MAKETLYRCDKQGCNLTRPAISETNHWFVVGQSEEIRSGILVYRFDSLDATSELGFGDDKIFCGEAHALEYISSEIRKLHPSREQNTDQTEGVSSSKYGPMP